jgi:quinol-cytochrome oxidoreductase complex cytochrome b subunit
MQILKNIFLFYYNGFKNLTSTSRKLWILIIIKSSLILAVLFLFFPDVLDKYDTQEQKAEVVANNLLK